MRNFNSPKSPQRGPGAKLKIGAPVVFAP